MSQDPVILTLKGTWCHPQCSFLDYSTITPDLQHGATCKLLKREVGYYDGFLAECTAEFPLESPNKNMETHAKHACAEGPVLGNHYRSIGLGHAADVISDDLENVVRKINSYLFDPVPANIGGVPVAPMSEVERINSRSRRLAEIQSAAEDIIDLFREYSAAVMLRAESAQLSEVENPRQLVPVRKAI